MAFSRRRPHGRPSTQMSGRCRRRDEPVRRDDREDKPVAQRGSGVPRLTEEQAREGPLDRNGPRQHPRVATAREDAEHAEPADEPGVLRRDAQVAGQREVEPGAHRRAVDRGDGEQWRVQNPQETAVDLADQAEVALGGALEGG
jgi:hypothetical protein